jgi:hypothetical protein
MANRRFAALLAIQNEWADTTPDDESHLKLAEQGEIQLAQAESLAKRVDGLVSLIVKLRAFVRGKHSTIPFGPQALLDDIDAVLASQSTTTTTRLDSGL